jgi:hypothetical protein
VHEGGTNVRSSTSRALGFLFVALGSAALGNACSSSSDSSGAAPPPFSGTVSTSPGSSASAGVDDTNGPSATDTTRNTSTGSQQTAGSSAPSSNEGAPNVSQLTPSQPAANAGSNSNSGSGGTSNGAMQAQGAAGQAASPPQGAAGQAATPPSDQQQPPAAGNTQVFLLFGQSNMWGVPAPEQQDLAINPHVEVLTITKCAKHDVNQWVPAQPPLHGCVGMPSGAQTGPGVGPGDYFAKTLADAFPNDTILLVPGAVPSVSIDTFQRGQTNYDNLLARAKMAQQRGPIKGMIFHQGENDSGQPSWPMRVKNAVTALRADLNIGDVPFVAGELLYSPPGCCGTQHNPLVDMLPSVITNTAIVKTNDLTALTKAQDTFGVYHFNLSSQRTLGQRYGQAMLQLLGSN